MRDIVMIGTIVRPHGVRGDVRVHSREDYSQTFVTVKRVSVGSSSADAVPFDVTRARAMNGDVTLHFRSVSTRNEAEELRGLHIFAEKGDIHPSEKKARPLDEQIGMTVTSDDGVYTGKIAGILRMPAHPVYVLEIEGREVLIPAVPAFVLEVDQVKKTVVIRNIPGLFEES